VNKVPYVEKQAVTIVAIDDPTEPHAVRAMLEGLGYLVTVHGIGSREELLRILRGELRTEDTVVISGHGDEAGLLVPVEAPIGPAEVAQIGRLDGKTVINLACLGGTPEFAEAFKAAGVAHYIGPDDYPDFRDTLMFVSILFFLLAREVQIEEAVARASAFHGETTQFRLLV
jgi:hypothetical protein